MSAEENKALVRRSIEEVFNQRNLDAADEIFAPTYTHHDPATPGLPTGPAASKQVTMLYRTAFPDGQTTIEDMIAEGDKVVTRWTERGTHQGELMGIPPTGKQVMVTGVQIDRIAGGKIVEEWVNFDALGLMQQLGVIPAPRQGGS